MSERVLVTGSDPEALVRAVDALLEEPLPWCRASDPEFDQATVWFCAGAPPEAPILLPRLRWIQSGWAGIENWLGRPEWRHDVLLTRTVGDFPQRIAQYAIGYLLARVLQMDRAFRGMAERTWSRWTPGSVAGKNLLVVGMGAIGVEVAAAARAFGMHVAGVTRGAGVPGRALDETGTRDLPQLLGWADVVVNLLPLTRETESFWNAERFPSMKPGSIFLNASRGRTVDEGALLRGLSRGRPGFAILDVFREEPLPPESPLRGREDVWITPHVAGIGTPEALGRDFAENWKRYRDGEPLRNVVDRARGY